MAGGSGRADAARSGSKKPAHQQLVATVSLENASIQCYIFRMERDAAIARLREHEAELRRLGVQRLYLFGSTARGEARDDSDVDLFFDFEKGSLSLFGLMDVKQRTAQILGREADVMTRDSMHLRLRKRIEASALQVF
jgi:predicted nucleotidyltransferase